ncbi:MAG TPA: hypothetical protein VHE99_08370 [Gammaproteobacteria bacterium]|nr:hypothetical protein [Gammaproteobacteria bacterium]
MFIDLFNQVKNDTAASSYYLLDASGSFLFLDDSGTPTWLIVKTEDEIREFAQQAEYEGAPKELLESLKKGEVIAHFNNFDEYVDATNGDWSKYLFPAKIVKGVKQYHYSILKSLPGFPIKQNKIFPFSEYLNSNSPT